MKIKYSLFVVIVFLFIELIAQSIIILFDEKKYSLFIKPLLSSKKNFIDYLHFTPKGNEVLASEIAKFIN